MNCSCLRAAVLTLSTVILLPAQTGTGSVNGSVSDGTGSAVPNAVVKLTNTATRIVDQAQTNNSGYFVFLNLRPGGYALSVEAQGFKKAQIAEFPLDVNQTATHNVTLELGSINDTITVTSEAPLLQQT